MFGKELFGSTPFGGTLGIPEVIQKALRYVVGEEVEAKTIQKSLDYDVIPLTRRRLSLRYRVRLRYQDKYQPKDSEYAEKYQSQESEYADKYVSKGTKYRKRY